MWNNIKWMYCSLSQCNWLHWNIATLWLHGDWSHGLHQWMESLQGWMGTLWENKSRCSIILIKPKCEIFDLNKCCESAMNWALQQTPSSSSVSWPTSHPTYLFYDIKMTPPTPDASHHQLLVKLTDLCIFSHVNIMEGVPANHLIVLQWIGSEFGFSPRPVLSTCYLVFPGHSHLSQTVNSLWKGQLFLCLYNTSHNGVMA